jgi:hypothetical protein
MFVLDRTGHRRPASTHQGASPVGRALVLLGLSVALVLGTSAAASATFTDSVTLASTTVGTIRVEPPTGFTATSRCTGNAVNVTLNWVPSTSEKVVGYQVALYLEDGPRQPQANLAPTVTTWARSADKSYATDRVLTFSVTTFTSYGWTKESVRTDRIVC